MKHTGYTPPLTVTAKSINLIAEISAQIERYAIRLETLQRSSAYPQLRLTLRVRIYPSIQRRQRTYGTTMAVVDTWPNQSRLRASSCRKHRALQPAEIL